MNKPWILLLILLFAIVSFVNNVFNGMDETSCIEPIIVKVGLNSLSLFFATLSGLVFILFAVYLSKKSSWIRNVVIFFLLWFGVCIVGDVLYKVFFPRYYSLAIGEKGFKSECFDYQPVLWNTVRNINVNRRYVEIILMDNTVLKISEARLEYSADFIYESMRNAWIKQAMK